MPKFKVGDRVRVSDDAHGAPTKLLGVKGTVSQVTGILETGKLGPVMTRTSHKEQLYDVEFDELGRVDSVYESWLETI